MAKKIIKVGLCLLGIASVILGIITIIQRIKAKNHNAQDVNADSETEEQLNAEDALDLSSLKFSRHYVDLR